MDSRSAKTEDRSRRRIRRVGIILLIIALAYMIVTFLTLFIVHGIVMKGFGYEKYNSKKYLVYADVAEDYPREHFYIKSGENNLSAYLYGKGNEEGVIIVSPGHGDANDIKIYEIRYFVDAGYEVICYDYTGYFTSEGDQFGGYTQSVYDLDALLCFVENDPYYEGKPLYLFGHSMGGYASLAVLNMEHSIAAVVAASPFDNSKDQWQVSVKRYTGWIYPIVKPVNSLFIQWKYGKDKDMSAIDGINHVDIPVLVLSAAEDVYYGNGPSPVYEKREAITNPKCKMRLMDQPGHDHHYDYFLTDAAIAYQRNTPEEGVDKELILQHNDNIMQYIIDFYKNDRK